jgi:hypothetical protein
MPLFGIDTSHYQAGMNYRQVAAEGLTFVVGKVSEGAGFRDPQWVATPRSGPGGGAAGRGLPLHHRGASGGAGSELRRRPR